ncbi:hypothetical protein BASA81_002232 [Batrachochytrium salamandrivorans]|nr:hypothetical protein BASA81_002232 [Batrachochytrium salamandrivorans]
MKRWLLLLLLWLLIAYVGLFVQSPWETKFANLPPPLRPFRPIFISLANHMLHGFGPSFDPKVIMDKARKTTGLQDFQDDTGTFALGLSKLCESLQQEANLNFVGKMMTRAQLDITVENRLKIAQATSSVPIPLTQPVFVVGMPRSGTTFLHNLLSLDDETFRAPRLWEIVDPLPVPETGTWLTSWRLFKSHMGTLVFQYLAPNFASVHPVGSLQAEECMPILSLSMLSFQFYTMMNVPGYNDWLMPRSQMEALLWHKRFLQAVTTKRQHQRWLLKAPWHMNHLDELLTVYPDAKVIVPHRTPEGMLASLSSLHARLFAMTSDELDLTGLGNYTRQVWEQILGKFMAARTQLPPTKCSTCNLASCIGIPLAL